MTLAPMPLAAVYTASKVAIEGFTASLAFELAAFDVWVELVEPGYCPSTRFAENVGARLNGLIPESYACFAEPVFAAFGQPAEVTRESDVAEAVFAAANDTSPRLGFAAGADAVALAVAAQQTVAAPSCEVACSTAYSAARSTQLRSATSPK